MRRVGGTVAKDDFYGTKSSNTDFYGATQSEINMRTEFQYTLDGRTPEIAKAQPALFRKMRLDADDNKISCDCVSALTREPDRDRFCPICYGEGYLWDETSLDVYKTLENSDSSNSLLDKLHSPGLIKVPVVVFYIRHSIEITEKDKIVLVALELDGTASSPTRRTAIFRVGKAWDYRADNGKIEYWKVFTREESVKYLNKPSYAEI